MRRWEFLGGGSAKFWEAQAEGAVTVRYGRVGARGRTQVRELDSAEAARRYLAKVIAEKERKRFAALKKDVRTVAGDQVRRLEAAMVGRRSWSSTSSPPCARVTPIRVRRAGS